MGDRPLTVRPHFRRVSQITARRAESRLFHWLQRTGNEM